MDENVLGNVVGSLIDRNKDNDGWGSNGFIWVILLLFLCGGNFGLGNNRGVATTNDVATSSMFNQLDGSLRSIERGQSNLGYDNLAQFNSTNMMLSGGMANLSQAISENRFAQQNCCCETNRNIDAVRYENAQNTCAITTNDTANTQKILDAICQLKSEAKDNTIAQLRSDLQAAQLTLSNANQTQNIIGALRMPNPIPAYVVSSPYYGGYNGTVIA